MKEIKTIRPQVGFQMDFLASKADIVIGGGSAGCFVKGTKVLLSSGKPL